jgi:hypothetical protein
VTWVSSGRTRPRFSGCRSDGKPRALTSDPRLPPTTVGAEDDQG